MVNHIKLTEQIGLIIVGTVRVNIFGGEGKLIGERAGRPKAKPGLGS